MLLFCPSCSNILIASRIRNSIDSNHGSNRFECRTCPYQYVIENRFFERKEMKRKEVEEVIGAGDSWENVDQMDVQCPNEKCESTRAFFYQLQIRSADEPMTSFFKCVKCARQWRE